MAVLWPFFEALQNVSGMALSAPRGQTFSRTVLPLPIYTKCPSARSLAQASFCFYPLLTSCMSLGGPGPMDSFSEWEKLPQTGYTTQSVDCAMMWQLASIHGSPWYAPTYWPYVDTTHRQSKQHPTNRGCNLTVTFRQGLYWLGYGWSSAWLNFLIL